MKAWLRGFYYSFPIQLLFLHFRKYQVLLVFWFVLFSTVNGSFMKSFGAGSLYLAPEYLGNVNAVSSSIVGMTIGMFMMSWNVSTFILFSKQFRFLAATTNPFLKYCINNAIIPFAFLAFYFIKAYEYAHIKELLSITEILFLVGGFVSGICFVLAISFYYFFRVDRNILRQMMPTINNPKSYITHLKNVKEIYFDTSIIHVEWYFESFIRFRRTRDVSHYTQAFVDSIFKRHHFASILSVLASFVFLVIIGFFLDTPVFQIPAAASITIFFSILIAVAGAFSYFLQSWSMPYLVGLLLLLNFFYRVGWIDPTNKAYGINYLNKSDRPLYSSEGLRKLTTKDKLHADSLNMIEVLENWKARQSSEKPILVLLNTSGGGNRSATFTMSMLQHLDSISHGRIMKNVFLISGASGGMIGATYFRELYLRRQNGENINLQNKQYVHDIAGDLLNPLFSSFIARDLIAPAQKFSVGQQLYVKDRGYAFEEKLNRNTRGFLNKQLKDYIVDEKAAHIPLIFFNSVITRDSRKLYISTQPVSFMMSSRQSDSAIKTPEPDALDFAAFFNKQDPFNLRILTALRMNATFPVVLPNVWLPSNPVIDVMDAGLRDNFGEETSLRFMHAFDDWIKQNCSAVVILQIKDRGEGAWSSPFLSDDLSDHLTKPFLLLQHNWFKMMEFFQNEMLSYYADNDGRKIYKISFQYAEEREENKAALNFHLTKREQKDIMISVFSPFNQESSKKLISLVK